MIIPLVIIGCLISFGIMSSVIIFVGDLVRLIWKNKSTNEKYIE